MIGKSSSSRCRIKSICEGITSGDTELRAEISKLRAQLEESLSSNDIKLRGKVLAVTKRSAEQVNSLKQTVAQKDRAITEVNDMALHVADEFNQLKNEKLAKSRSITKQLEHHKKLAAIRLEKLTELQQVTVDQQVNTIDEMRENHEEKESMSTTKIAGLTSQLHKSEKKIETLECELAEAVEEVHKLSPLIIQKKGKRLEWDSVVTQLIMEHLANRTSPTCICPNILATLELIIPNYQIMDESPGIRFVRTSRRQIELNNFVAKVEDIFCPGQTRKITLDGCIIAEDGSAEATAIQGLLQAGRTTLDLPP
eukprot:scaffold116894_cov80-Cyclotella_meneghiniana.AAC.3